MTGKCYACGEVGHPSFLCPKGGGKGCKGGKGGKGGYGGKGSYGGKGGKGFVGKCGYGGKALGKGYQGSCFNCGKLGHKAWECRGPPKTSATNNVEQRPNQDVEIDTVEADWSIGNVTCKVRKPSDKPKNSYVPNRVITQNTFGPLQEELDPNRLTEPANDSRWPEMIDNKPANNRKGPKVISISEALQPRKKMERVEKWKMVNMSEPEEDPNTMMIAPVSKTVVKAEAKTKLMIAPVT